MGALGHTRESGRARAWTVSIAVHAAVGLALAAALAAGRRDRRDQHAPEAPRRLVWVEPAPPAAEVDALSGPLAPAPPAAPNVETPPAPPPVARLATRSAGKRAPKPRSAPVARVAPPERSDAPSAPGTAAAEPDRAGVTGAVPHGIAGGVGDAPLRLSSVASPPELVERVVPEYPARARAQEIEGQVVLEVVLDRAGRPEPDVRVLKSVALLDAAAIAAVRQWRFRPARDADGRPVRVIMEVPVRFVLR
jgi:protein TonB